MHLKIKTKLHRYNNRLNVIGELSAETKLSRRPDDLQNDKPFW